MREGKAMRKYFVFLSLLMLILVFFTASFTFAEGRKENVKKELTFMMISRNIADPFHAIIANGAEATCKKLGVKFILKDSNVNQTTQLNIIDSAIALKVDGVAINAVDEVGVIPGIKALNEAGIPVVGFDVIASGGKMIGAIGIDNYKIVKIDGEETIKLLKEKYGRVPEGVVLNIQGDMSMKIGQQRSKGFTDVMDKYPQLTVASAQGMWNPTDANRVTSDLLTRYGDKVVAIHVATGCMTDGVAAAVESAGYDLHNIVFVDNGVFPIDLKLIREGKLDCSAVIPCSAQGELAMKLLYWNAKGMKDKLPKVGTTLVEKGAFWSPADVIKGAVGPIIQTNVSLLCPQDISVDDPHLLGNEIIAWQKAQKKK